jgi:hypothetical protein
MKTKEILIIGLFIITVCIISLIPFSNINAEGFVEGNTSGNVNVTSASVTTVPKETISAEKIPSTIKNNNDFINALIVYLSKLPNRDNDTIAIYKLQGQLSAIKTQNAATLLGEIANPNNLYDPRLFLKYMNWFASHCPIDSNVCTGLC